MLSLASPCIASLSHSGFPGGISYFTFLLKDVAVDTQAVEVRQMEHSKFFCPHQFCTCLLLRAWPPSEGSCLSPSPKPAPGETAEALKASWEFR